MLYFSGSSSISLFSVTLVSLIILIELLETEEQLSIELSSNAIQFPNPLS